LQVGFRRQALYLAAKSSEAVFVGGVLRLCVTHIDGATRKMCQLAVFQFGADFPSECDEHGGLDSLISGEEAARTQERAGILRPHLKFAYGQATILA
jgi:hypothetical protein